MSVDKSTLDNFVKDPAAHFSDPEEVINHAELSDEEKRKILESWRVDEQELITATGENMGTEDSNILPRVVAALEILNR